MLPSKLILPQALAERAAADPSGPLVQLVDGAAYTAADVDQQARTWAAALRDLGVTAGATVATMLPNAIDAYVVWLGVAWLRAIEVPVNNAFRGHMLQYVINHSRAEVLVTTTAFLPRILDQADELSLLKKIVVVDADSRPASASVGSSMELFAANDLLVGPPVDDAAGPQAHDIAAIIYTSGTTGPSKGVLVPWGSLFQATGAPVDDDTPTPEPEVLFAYFPPFHLSGKTALYSTVLSGSRMALRDGFSLTAFWDEIERYGCTTTAMPAAVATLLYSQPEQPGDSANSLTTVLMGPVIPDYRDFERRFGVTVGTAYGMTEIGHPLRSEDGLPNNETCGRAQPGYAGLELRIVDEHDWPVPAGEIGELIVRSSQPWALNAGYWDMPEETARAWRNGWFHTGDGFRCDADGNYYFVDRLKDTLRRRGENISSFEVEAQVMAHPAVLSCAAIGVPSELGEDDLKICVVCQPGETLAPADLWAYLKDRMAAFMVPRYIEMYDELPQTEATFRIRKAELRREGVTPLTWDSAGHP